MNLTLIEQIRASLEVEEDVLDEELPGLIHDLRLAYTDLATAQAAELARKDAVFDRIIATAKDGLRQRQDPPPKPNIITGD